MDSKQYKHSCDNHNPALLQEIKQVQGYSFPSRTINNDVSVRIIVQEAIVTSMVGHGEKEVEIYIIARGRYLHSEPTSQTLVGESSFHLQNE